MPAQRDRNRTKGGVTAEALARKLSDAVRSGANGNGNRNGNGNGAMDRETARRLAVDVGAAMLQETSGGTAQHSSDVVLIAEAIGERMGITDDDAGDLLAAARLHDIGKAWIPNALLDKPGGLSDDEWELMRQHTLVGQRILSSIPELDEVGLLVRHSHERWDGGGYPDGLAGAEIPLGSRIIFCADAFHAIRSDRPYRAGRAAREAVAEINRCAGTQFDPRVAGALEEVVRERGRRPRAMGGSSRLFALLMCLVIGGAGTAIARSGALGESDTSAPPISAPKPPPPACGTAACPTVAGPVGGLAAVGGPGAVPGPRPLSPGLPGGLHRDGLRGAHGAKANHGKSAEAKARHPAKAKAKGGGATHSSSSHGGNESAGARNEAPPDSSSSSGGGGSGGHSSSSHSSGRSGGTHHSSGSHGSGRGGSRGRGSGGESSNGNSGGSHGR